ncbi:MAG: LVIVD repeat-containing protein [Actinomycetota bacterium]
MKRKIAALFAALALPAAMLAGPQGASAGPSQGGISTDNVEYVSFLPFEGATSTGVSIVGKYMYLTSWKSLSIYDISDPLNPALAGGPVPLGFQFENENVAVSPDGKIMLFSESLPQDVLHVWDVEDKTSPVEIASVENAGDHTSTCVLKCNWVYGSDGSITDLRNPEKPKLFAAAESKNDWHKQTGLQGGGHDVEEYRNGFLVSSPISAPAQILDVRKPTKPKVLGLLEHPDPQNWLFHSGRWPRRGNDKFVLMQGEQNANTRCNDNTGPFLTFKRTGKYQFKLIDTYRVANGTYVDGSPAVNGLGCSAHWFQEHPTFRNGGLVAMGYYEHGTRFFNVAKSGKIKEVGWFLPHGGSTSAAYWVTKDIAYAVDYTRGIDILKFTDKKYTRR